VASLISPRDLGLPEKFPAWRPGQYESIEAACTSETKFVSNNAPTGSGKSVFAAGCSSLLSTRTVILTSTKNLQDQYSDDFETMGICDMRGRQNYDCVERKHASCSEGRILGCKSSGCPYIADRNKFIDAPLGVTNYSYFLSSILHANTSKRKKSEDGGDREPESGGLGQIGLLICDEAHNIPSEVCSVIEIKIDHSKNQDIYNELNIRPPYRQALPVWREWAIKAATPVAQHLEAMKRAEDAAKRGISRVHKLASDLARLASVSNDWILDEFSSLGDTIVTPLWPTEHTHKLLFSQAERVFFISASAVPKTYSILGVPDESLLSLKQKYTFNPNRNPVYLFGPSRIDSKSSDGQLAEWIGRMDSLIDRREDRKGIIHTVSYPKQKFISTHSVHRDIILAPRADALARILRQFRESPPPCVLASPAVTTGYDFPYNFCEYQIISKVPFIDSRPPIMAARNESDPEYLPYLTAQTLVQTCGRGMRAEDDQCENFILDQHANWFLRPPEPPGKRGGRKGGYLHLCPDWFQLLIRYPRGQPLPPPALSV
jgi:ATP-dependent DNA helicase DinG